MLDAGRPPMNRATQNIETLPPFAKEVFFGKSPGAYSLRWPPGLA